LQINWWPENLWFSGINSEKVFESDTRFICRFKALKIFGFG
jgi:hypothetical protein